MRFTYTYRSSDGQRRTAEIEAESRDAAFAKVRTELGIKPIKVVAAEGESGAGRAANVSAAPRRMLWGAAILAAAALTVVGGVWWWRGRRGGVPETITVNTPQGAITYTVATPLPRQAIPGDRRRIEDGRDNVLTNRAEHLLACFAEPGRAAAVLESAKPTEAEFAACLREPIRIASTDFTEVVDLKRIVTGMKREMRAYIAGGGNVKGYLTELEKRQRLEISYRDNAERRLNDMLNGQDARSPSATGGTPVVPVSGQDARGRDPLKAAYAYWLKANAQLKSMGIYELSLPDPLRSYQSGLELE